MFGLDLSILIVVNNDGKIFIKLVEDIVNIIGIIIVIDLDIRNLINI